MTKSLLVSWVFSRLLHQQGFSGSRPGEARKTGGKTFPGIFLGGVLAAALSFNSFATTVYPLGFNDLVAGADSVVIGTVVDLQVRSMGQSAASAGSSESSAPMQEPEQSQEDSDDSLTGSTAATTESPGAPVSAGVEGGLMLFTRVTLSVENAVSGGSGAGTISFDVAGGNNGEVEVTVFGMPSFEMGKKYMVFLNHKYEETKVPVVGVNQGFFEVIVDEQSGEESLRTTAGDIVVSVEGDTVVVQRGPDNAANPEAELTPPPVPDGGHADVQASMSNEVARYWQAAEAPMRLTDFVSAVRSAKEGE